MRRSKPVGRAAASRVVVIDKKEFAAATADNDGALPPPLSAMPLDCTVLVVGSGVPAFKAEHVGAALRARGASGYWLVEVEPRSRANGSGALAQTLVGFPGLHIERISANDL